MKKIILVQLLLVLLAACGAQSESTPTLEPPSTATSEPTATETPEPTPDAAATESTVATEQAAELAEDIQLELETLGFSTEGSLAWVQQEPVRVVVNEQNFGGVYKDPGVDTLFRDFVLGVDVTWETTTGFSGCGIIFRSDADLARGQQIQFWTSRLSGAPLWGFDLIRYGQFQATLGDGANGAIRETQGSTNHYIVSAQGLTAVVYINGTRVATTTLPAARTEGRLAFLTWQDSGRSTCTFENGWVWEIADS